MRTKSGAVGAERLEAGANRDLPGRAAGNRRTGREAGGCDAKRLRVLGVNDRLHGIDTGMRQERPPARADHGFPGDAPVLLWNVAAGALATSGRDNNSRNSARHMASLRSPLRHSL